jgi:transcriptional regulator with XRE-family HTH domain
VETFASKLKAFMDERGLSIAVFARTIEANPSTVWRWLHGKSQPDPVYLATIRERFGVDLGGDGPPGP